MPRGIPKSGKRKVKAGWAKAKNLDTKNMSPEEYFKKTGRKKPGPAPGFKRGKKAKAAKTGRVSAKKANVSAKPKAERKKPGPKPGFKRNKLKGPTTGAIDLTALTVLVLELDLGQMVTLREAMVEKVKTDAKLEQEELESLAEMRSSGWDEVSAIKQILADKAKDAEMEKQQEEAATGAPTTADAVEAAGATVADPEDEEVEDEDETEEEEETAAPPPPPAPPA